MRNAFIDELVIQAAVNSRIALVVGDLGYSVVEPFAEKFPERFINAGVAEQNMMGLAAGMASEGYHVFVYSIANFPTFRCAEQIRNDVAYHNLPVTVVSVGGGMSYGNLGYSHHAIQDYGLIRLMPNMLIAAPGDPFEVRGCLRYLVANPQPSYLRLGKAGEPNFNKGVPDLRPGHWVPLTARKGSEAADKKKICILTTGAVLELTLRQFYEENTDHEIEVYSVPLWGQKYKAHQLENCKKFHKLITVEDHLVDCGFGSWMLEALSVGGISDRLRIIGINSSVLDKVGSQSVLNNIGGLANIFVGNILN